jgi:hypothetical protein
VVELEKTNAVFEASAALASSDGLATGAFLAAGRPAAAQEDQPGGESDRKKATCWFSRKGTMRVKSSNPVI